MPEPQQRNFNAYFVAVLATGIVAGVRFALRGVLGETAPFFPFTFAILLAGWMGGLGPALLATGLGGLVGTYLFVAPAFSFVLPSAAHATSVALYFVNGVLVSLVCETVHRLHRAARRRQRELESEMVDRIKAVQSLRDSEERFRLMANAAPVLIWLSGADKLRTWFNQSWLDFVGRRMEREIGDGWADNVHADDFDRCLSTYRAAFDARRPFSMEYRLRRRDGEYCWLLDHGVPRYELGGQFAGYIGSCIDITDRRRSEESLREADRRKNEFLSVLSHELRNPLAAIRNAVAIERAKATPETTVLATREIIERQVRHMAQLVGDLFDVSRVSANKMRIVKERVDLMEIVQRAVETVQPLIDAAGHRVVLLPPLSPLCVEVDPIRLSQVFSNVLNNAVKYTPNGGAITLVAERVGSDAIVRIRDAGIGIAGDDLERIFEPFLQGGTRPDEEPSGLGVGLSLAKALVEIHGGSISARSEGPGKGSEFVIRLPIVIQPALGPATPDQALVPRSERSHRVLIVDDLRDSADSLAMLTSMGGHEVRTAYDGEEAVRFAESFRPHVVVLDIGMDKMNGYEACRCIRQQPWGKDMLLIAVTGWGQEEDRRRALATGFDEHMVKPIDPPALMRFLATIPHERIGAAEVVV